jgi:hypothetical protein
MYVQGYSICGHEEANDGLSKILILKVGSICKVKMIFIYLSNVVGLVWLSTKFLGLMGTSHIVGLDVQQNYIQKKNCEQMVGFYLQPKGINVTRGLIKYIF